MSNSAGFSGTITGGIQDISALLPLLGTEQCENHVGSALDRGYLYSSVTPVSIFGSLGIVRAAFNTLVASLTIQQYRILGATKLKDGGFTPTGDVAPMIALDPKHPKRFLAETQLEAMLTEENIENVEDLTVSWGKDILRWNSLLIVFTLVISSIGLLPYIPIILEPNPPHKALFPLGLGFPLLRVAGSVICVNVAQFVIQIRILVLLKTRLLFITMDRLARQGGIDNLESHINEQMNRTRAKSAWNSELASEKCIWALERCLADPDAESARWGNNLKASYEAQYKRHMESINARIPRGMGFILAFVLVLGCSSTIVGYVGCFYLVQHSTTARGPLLWLILEALLSILRILIWAINPSWDDSTGIVFELQLALHAPLITCNQSDSDITKDGISPLMRSNRFLDEVVAYTGPLPAFVVPDVALYYIFTAKGGSESINAEGRPSGILYIVLSDHKEQTSRILFKGSEGRPDEFSIFISSIEFVPGSTAISVRVDFTEGAGKTDATTNFLTSDPIFMAQLGAHYDEINSRIQKSNPHRKAPFGKTWAMQRPSEDDNEANKRERVTNIILTTEDVVYLHQGQIERRSHDIYKQLEEWIGLFVALYTKELLQDVPTGLVFKKDESVTIVQKYEANEVEFLLLECQRILELLLTSTSHKWDEYLTTKHAKMVEDILQGTFESITEQQLGTTNERHSNETRKKKMQARLALELKTRLEKEGQIRRDNMRNRRITHMESTNQRIQGRKYADGVGEVIISTWKALPSPEAANLTSGSTKTPADPVTESGSAPIVETIASWRDKFIAKMTTRYREAKKDVDNYKEKGERNKQLIQVRQMNDRCRLRADLLFSRLEAQKAEFEDLHPNDILTGNARELVKYWSTKSLQERGRLQDRTHRYLRLTDASIEAVGGQRNMVRALKRSQGFLFIDIHESSLMTSEDITSIVNCVKSVTGVSLSSPRDNQDIYKAVVANVQAAVGMLHDVCFYANLEVTDHNRPGKPYLLFTMPGASFCEVHFYIQTKCDHNITLRHCVTMNSGKVSIKLNGYGLQGSWGEAQAVQFNFINEDILLPNDHLRDVGQLNVLEIVLDYESSPGYWLSDVFLPAHPVHIAVTSDATTTYDREEL